MKHNLHKMLCLLLVAVLLWGTLPVALATALPVDTGQAAEPAPEASTAPTKEGTEPTEVSQPVPEGDGRTAGTARRGNTACGCSG